MNAFIVNPLVGIGPVQLGMSRQQVRNALDVPVTPFWKAPGEASQTDAFLDNAFQVFYDKDDRADFIELSRGGPFVALWDGVSVFEERADALVARLSRETALDRDRREQGYTFVFPRLELSLWRQCLPKDVDEEDGEGEELGAYFDTIGVGRPGYFSGGAV